MAIDGYMYFMDYDGKFQKAESQVNVGEPKEPLWTKSWFKWKEAAAVQETKGSVQYAGLFEIEDFSFDIEQTLNIGSQSTGAGAGRATFNPFSITRKIDRFSPILFQQACSGTPFKQVALGLRKGSGTGSSGQLFVVFMFKLVAVKTISWSYDDESPKETVTFEYGGLQCHYSPQLPNGTMDTPIPGGWNRVRNRQDTEGDEIK